MSMGKKSVLSPFKFWGNVFKNPNTVRFPREDIDTFGKPGASPTYRGLHTNDITRCIGCGTCEDICPTNAITMVEGENVGEGKLGQRPRIDYGRCCFCGFCVDMCPSRSLSMSRHYLRNYRTPAVKIGQEEVDDIRENFTLVPDDTYGDEPGHVTPDEESWLDLYRVPMKGLKPEERWSSFAEIIGGFTREEALREASRCIECGICAEACPAGMKVPEYIKAIWDEDLDESVRQMYLDNPLPNVCGRVCTHVCESVCAISHRGKPIAIRWLKRYAVDNLDPDRIERIAADIGKRRSGKTVSIVGSGPAGLSAAYYLAIMGHSVIVYEQRDRAGGIMRYGIPRYRLPDEALDRDIDAIRKLGVKIVTGKRVGKDVGFREIREKSDAVYIASGFSASRSTGIEGIECAGCFQAIDMLRELTEGREILVGKKIVIIGGGNVAFDIARSLARLQRSQYDRVDITVTCLEKRGKMLADEEEVLEGEEEGLVVKNARYPSKVELDGKGKIKGLDTVACLSIFDEEGRFNPKTDESDRELYPADMVIEAIGQAPDYGFLGDEGAKLDIVRGKVVTDELGGTDIEGVFAGGDIVHGPDIVHAVADGHRSARAIDEYLTGAGVKA
jgi:glutamate synthase (NADPH/NADH) small chain